MPRRPTSLHEIVQRYEPACAGLTGAELESRWLEISCRVLCGAARAMSYSEADVRRCAFQMLIDSTAWLKIARDACEALSYRNELLERMLATLSGVLDDLMEWQERQGASVETLELWGLVSQYVADPRLSQALADDLKLVRN